MGKQKLFEKTKDAYSYEGSYSSGYNYSGYGGQWKNGKWISNSELYASTNLPAISKPDITKEQDDSDRYQRLIEYME
jgi:hypothetical protein